MSAFNKEDFIFSGGYLTYNGQFVARFKYQSSNAKSFKSFLTKNFTEEEYFEKLNVLDIAPLLILREKGYLSPPIKKMLKQQGYAPTVAGFELCIKDQVEENHKCVN